MLSETEARNKTNELKTRSEKINLLIQHHSNTLDESCTCQRNRCPTNLINSYEKDPSTTSRDPIIYTKKELLQQNTKLMDQVHTMRIKTDKLDSLILEEHDNLS